MKNFIKRFWGGLLATVVMVALAVVLWAFCTVAALAVVVLSPVILILSVHGSYKVASVGDAAKKFLDDLEGVIDNAENKLS
jgi:cobalamin biosynthesis protein CobD/CbiB